MSYRPEIRAAFPDGLPPKIAALPIDGRGYPVPSFIGETDGRPDHRFSDPKKIVAAERNKLCYICGRPRGRYLAFPVGPLALFARATGEPPAHLECCEFAVKACPFLTRPNMHRRPDTYPDHVKKAIEYVDAERDRLKVSEVSRNPGVMMIYVTRSYEIAKVGPDVIWKLGKCENYQWYCEGRKATVAEVQRSIDSGMDELKIKNPAKHDLLMSQINSLKEFTPR